MNAGWQLLLQRDQSLPLDASPQHDSSESVEPDEAADVLADVDSEHRDCRSHDPSLQFELPARAPAREGPISQSEKPLAKDAFLFGGMTLVAMPLISEQNCSHLGLRH